MLPDGVSVYGKAHETPSIIEVRQYLNLSPKTSKPIRACLVPKAMFSGLLFWRYAYESERLGSCGGTDTAAGRNNPGGFGWGTLIRGIPRDGFDCFLPGHQRWRTQGFSSQRARQ